MSKIKKNCSLVQWLKKYDKKLYNAIEESCALSLLRPGKGIYGITLLYPSDKSLRNHIISLLEYNDMEGVRILQTLIIVDCLQSTEEWHTKKDDIPNRLGHKLEISSIDNNTVTLANGSVLRLMSPKKFAPREDRGNIAIWEYSGKTPPPQKGKKSDHKYIKKGAERPKMGGSTFLNKGITPYALAKMCETKIIALLTNKHRGDHFKKYQINNPYINIIGSYIKYIEKMNRANHDFNSLYEDILLKLSYCPEASFYIIFEPYCKSRRSQNTFLFDEWIAATKGINLYRNPANIFKHLVEKAATLQIAKKKRAETCDARMNVIRDLYPSGLRKSLLNAYDGNDIRAQHDEIRFIIHEKIYDILREGNSDQFKDLMFDIEMMQSSGHKKGRIIITTEVSSTRDQLDVASFYSMAVTFALSDCFLYVPYSARKKYEYIDELATCYGFEMDIVKLQHLELAHLTKDPHFIITQEPYYDYLEDVIRNQKDNPSYSVQSHIAESLDDMAADNPDNISPRMIDTINTLYDIVGRKHNNSRSEHYGGEQKTEN